MQTTISWSFNLLNERERSLLLTLAVFVGGFSLRAAEVVCSSDLLPADAVQVVLARLIDKSMLQVTWGNETTRYHLLIRSVPMQSIGLPPKAATTRRSAATWTGSSGLPTQRMKNFKATRTL